ncbi:putative acylamino-acid-releasing enzyme [Talaromyces proteolyticus]|uniref:Dipeptidyl-peptidase V n=1 Tax=Talaromyces proteolyticus TaxID=1131652 RepID=A0AAD4Q1W9_9EURO|nr:putative acylamino-acid-releasing enzyme [Talaromyces proteolyticus]KAH8698998.1 putative acylamino-acid-releasing enzyme [Talaromyces proteolyticus]
MARQDKHLIQSLCDLEIPKTIRLSPDRQSVLYSTELTWGHRKGTQAVSTLWLASTGRTDSSRQLTPGLYRDHSPTWSPDGKAVAFVSDRAGAGAKWAVYLLPLNQGGDVYPITPAQNTSLITAFAFSPDGTRVAFLSADEEDGDVAHDVRAWGEIWRYARLRVVDLRTKQIRSLELDRHVTALSWSPDGTCIGFASCLTPDIEESHLSGTTLSTIDADLGAVEDLCHFPKMIVDLTWAADGYLYFCGGVPADKMFAGYGVYRTSSSSAFHHYDWVGFGVENDSLGLIKDEKGNVFVKVQCRLESHVCLPDGKVVYRRKEELEAFDAAIGPGNELVLAVATSDINHPTEVFTTVSLDGEMTRMSNHGRDFADRQFGTCSFLTCLSTDGEVELDALYLTPSSFASTGGPRRPLPTAVLIHGGPNTRLTNAFNTYYYMLSPYLLSLGYGILLPNYRGSSGRGKRFASYSIGGLGVYDYADVIALTQCAIDMGYADKGRLLVGGWSQGGFLTNLCSVRNGSHGGGWRFQAAVPGASICDIDTMALTCDLGCAFEPELSRDGVIWNMDHDDIRNRAASALWAFKGTARRADAEGASIVPPMLILHGEADARCPVTQAWGLRRALQRYELPFELVIYPNQGHFFEEQKYWVDMALRIGRWCDKYIGNELQ